MVQIAISYFYHIRFFKPYMLPVSTAVWDPKWYHRNNDQDTTYIDKNGVINGLRVPMLAPGENCHCLCRGRELCEDIPTGSCKFLQEYRKQLDAIPFKEFCESLTQCSEKLKGILKFKEDPILVLMVHEKYDNPCSERVVLLDWFKQNGVDVQELKYPIKDNYN